MGLAHQKGNVVTLSYRQERFGRIKDRNERRMQKCIRAGKVNVIFSSNAVEITQDAVLLDAKGGVAPDRK